MKTLSRTRSVLAPILDQGEGTFGSVAPSLGDAALLDSYSQTIKAVVNDDLHKQLVADEIGKPAPLMFLRGTEKLFCMVVPRELPPMTQPTRRKSP